ASYPYGQPLDFNADGRVTGNLTINPSTGLITLMDTTSTGANYGKRRLTTINTNATASGLSSMKYQAYLRYDNPGGTATVSHAGPRELTNLSSIDAGWLPDSINGSQMLYYNPALTQYQGMLPGTPALTQLDEPIETIVDPRYLSASDSVFGVDEMASL